MADPTETQVLAIAAHKGGVGKTTTAMSLAAGLSRVAGARVLLIDLDPQAHSTIGLGLELADGERRTVRELFVDDTPRCPVHTLIHPAPNLERLWLVPSAIGLEKIAHTLPTRLMRQEILKAALRPLRDAHTFDWIVIDCPPSLGPLVENALCAADLVIVPCRMEARAADGLVDLLDMLEVLRPGFTSWEVLLTQRDARATRTNAAVEEALAPWGHATLATVIPKCEALNQAQMMRQDIYTYDPESTGAHAYLDACREVEQWANGAKAVSSIL